MNNAGFVNYLITHTDLVADELYEAAGRQDSLALTKGKYLLMAGDICRNSFFVERGLLRYFSIDSKGKEHVLQFAPENWFLADRESAYFEKPSRYFIQALEDSIVVVLDETFVSELTGKYPMFSDFNNRLLHNHIRHLQNRVNQLLSYTAEERYLAFIELYPDILLRVPQTMVASYLGITPESLSRVRKELSRKHFGQ